MIFLKYQREKYKISHCVKYAYHTYLKVIHSIRVSYDVINNKILRFTEV